MYCKRKRKFSIYEHTGSSFSRYFSSPADLRSVLLDLRRAFTTPQLSRLSMLRFGRMAAFGKLRGHTGVMQRPEARPTRRESIVNVVEYSCTARQRLMFDRAGEERSTGVALSCCWEAAGCADFLHSHWCTGQDFSIHLRASCFVFDLFSRSTLPLHTRFFKISFHDASEKPNSAASLLWRFRLPAQSCDPGMLSPTLGPAERLRVLPFFVQEPWLAL